MVIETANLTKYYGKKLACRDISLSVKEGEIFALLGPNGAGKSTFVKMLVGLVQPSSGEASILGKPLGDVSARKHVGYLPENFKYQEWMTGEELLSFHASLYRLDRLKVEEKIQEVLSIVKLTEHARYKVGTYSKGMQQRIGIACALICDPDLLFLDEPTSALDPIGRKEVREIILHLKSKGKTVLLNSHLLSEVEMVCDSAAFINKGTIIKFARMDEILSEKLVLNIKVDKINNEMLNELNRFSPNITCENDMIKMNIESKDMIPDIASAIVENGGRLYELSTCKENLESIFINLMEGNSR